MKILLTTPEGSPLVAMTPVPPVPEHFRSNSWGEVRSAEALPGLHPLLKAARRYLWAPRPESEVHHLASALAARLRAGKGETGQSYATEDGRSQHSRWGGANPPPVVGLVLLHPLGWGLRLSGETMARAENLAWLDEIIRQMAASSPSAWSHAWARREPDQQAEISTRLRQMRAWMTTAAPSASEEQEAALLQIVFQEAWRRFPPCDSSAWDIHYLDLWSSIWRQWDLSEPPWGRLGGRVVPPSFRSPPTLPARFCALIPSSV